MKISKKPYNFVCVIMLLTISFGCVNKSMEQSHRTPPSTKGDRSYASRPFERNPQVSLYYAYENGPTLTLYSILLKKDVMRVFWAPCELNSSEGNASLEMRHYLEKGFKLTKIQISEEDHTEFRMQKNGKSSSTTYPSTSCIYQFIKTENLR